MEYSEFFQRIRLPGSPQANPDSVVVRGNVRFTVLTERLLRLEWSPTGEFTDFATFAFPNRRLDQPPTFALHEDETTLRIETRSLTLSYQLGSGTFTPENLAISFQLGDQMQTWRPGQQDTANLGGTRRTLDLTGGDVPLELGLLSRDGWSLLDDSSGVVLLPDDSWVSARPHESSQDWYFFGYGHDYTGALAEYTVFGGAVPLIPRYVLGVWWSRFWPYSDSDLETLITEFADFELPLDVLVIDMDWHLPGHWTGYTWNHTLFPDPRSFLDRMHARGLHVTLNLHPADGIHPHEAAYEEMAEALGMVASDRSPIPFRITDRQFTRLYFTLLHHPLEEQGVDFWWIDWQQGENTEIAGLDPLLWLNHLHFTDAHRRGRRPLVFSRWGGLGNHRYPIGFSGDTYGGWATLGALPRFTATAANVGFGWWSHDIGGHFGMVDGEIFTRWIQFGALSPVLRLHAAKHHLAERQPWAFHQALPAIRHAFELRYQLIPYLYTMARHTHERGVAVCRPMYYAYPEYESAYHARGQYQLGDDLLAAPITEPADPTSGLATKDIWIPPGRWYSFATGEAVVGPRWIRLAVGLDTILLFARAGAIVPLAKPALHLANVPDDWLDIRVFPGESGSFRLYEDDGVSPAYRNGEFQWTSFAYTLTGPPEGVLHIDPVDGYCRSLSATRGYRVTFMAVDMPEQVVDERGAALPWTFDRETRCLQVTLTARSKREVAEVAVRWPPARAEAEHGGDHSTSLPFAYTIAYTASDEAARQLARLILVPPIRADNQLTTCDADILWRDVFHSSVKEFRQVIALLEAETILSSPLSLEPSLQPHHWEVETRLAYGNECVTTISHGPYINPPIQRWSLRYAGQAHWAVHQADVATRANIAEPYEVQLDPSVSSGAEATSSIDLAQPISVYFDCWTNGALSLGIDGKWLQAGQPRPTLDGLARPWQVVRFGPVALSAGKHIVHVELAAPDGPQWVFGVLLLGDDGAPVFRCTYIVDEPEFLPEISPG
jgi:hypothetical protein